MLWEAEVSIGNAVHIVELDPLELLTVEHDEVIFEDQERVVCDKNQALFLVVPVIHPEENTGSLLDKYREKSLQTAFTDKHRMLRSLLYL